jgi:putative ABC transport system permease protein
MPQAEESRSKNSGFMRFMRVNRKAKPINYKDYEFLRANIDYKYIYGMIESWQKSPNNEWIQVKATNNDFFKSKTYKINKGRYFNTFDEKSNSKVCIVGPYYAEEVLKDPNPLNKTISVGSYRYTVIGILAGDDLNKKKGFSFNPWERKMELKAVYIPLRTGSAYLRSNYAVDYVYLQAKSDSLYNPMKTQTTQLMLANHSMAHDFSFQDVGSMFMQINEEMDKMTKKWNLTLMAIASISLIVGGIGLFSTLLISINERMMEIGVRKSIGATDHDIFFYFIMEALVLSFLAALFGIGLAILLIKGIAMGIGFSMQIPLIGVVIGIGFALITGFLSGIYPAYKASKIDPIQAIYYFE